MRIVRIVVGLVLVIIMANCVLAQVEISEVLYDPVNTETGGEAVELHNTGSQDVDISGYKLGTELSMKDATLPNGTVIKANSYFLIADAGFSTLKDNPSWPNADYEEAITLTNTNAGVALIDTNGTIIDSVGWGDPLQIDAGLFEGTPANQVAQGMSLIRVNHSGNNAFDFAESSPDLVNSNGESGGKGGTNDTDSGIAFTVTVTNSLSTILSFFISDENPTQNGTQIVPMPKETKYVEVYVNASNPGGNNSIGNLSIVFSGISYAFNRTKTINMTTATYKAEIPVKFYDDPGQHNLSLFVNDGTDLTVINKTIEIQELNAYEIDAKSLNCNIAAGKICDIIGDMEMASADKPSVRNIGNIPLNFEVSGKNLVSGNKTLNASIIKYGFGDSALKQIGIVPALNAIELEQGNNSIVKMKFEVEIPLNAVAGNYTTQVVLTGVAS